MRHDFTLRQLSDVAGSINKYFSSLGWQICKISSSCHACVPAGYGPPRSRIRRGPMGPVAFHSWPQVRHRSARFTAPTPLADLPAGRQAHFYIESILRCYGFSPSIRRKTECFLCSPAGRQVSGFAKELQSVSPMGFYSSCSQGLSVQNYRPFGAFPFCRHGLEYGFFSTR